MNHLRINNQIQAPVVVVVDQNGEYLGQKNLAEALGLAKELGLDLIEVDPNSAVPVCRIQDFGKFQYRQAKASKKKELGQKQSKQKTIRFGVNIGAHDLEQRKQKVIEIFKEGDSVRIEMVLRGREKGHTEFAKGKLKTFLELLKPVIRENYEIKWTGGGFVVDIKPDQLKLLKLSSEIK